MRSTTASLSLAVAASIACSSSAVAQDPDPAAASTAPQGQQGPQFGGPDSVADQLRQDREPKPSVFRFDGLQRTLKPYFDLKDRLLEEHGFAFGFDYTAVALAATGDFGADRAASGDARFFGSWDLVGRESGNTGTFVWKIEHRHSYTAVAPSGYGFDTGYVGLYEPPFSDQGFRTTNLYWRQRFDGGRISFLLGFLDATDYVDVWALASPWTGFYNFAFSTGSASIPVPNDATLGLGGGAMITDEIYVIAGLADRNSDPTRPFDGFDTFFDDQEWFSHVELGWTASQDRIYVDNVHVTAWHADAQAEAGVSRGWGINFSAAYMFGPWLPFLRGGWADDGGSLLQKSIAAGFGWQPPKTQDQLGFGANWGEPNEDTFAPGLRDQYAFELFYRLQLSENFAITPDVQLLIDPALNPLEDTMWVFGLRGRLAF